MIRTTALAALFSSPFWLNATVLEPWYPERGVELQARADYYYQAFDTVQSSHGNFGYHARDSFLDLSVLGSVEGFGAELEVLLSDTKHHTFYPDCFKLTGRYLILNDSVDDAVSLMAGVTAIVPTTTGLDDISSFHHGHFEAEATLSVGKEIVCGDYWSSRYWAVGGIGCATDEGSPWVRADVNYETNWERTYFLRLFANTLWGLGGNAVRRHHFHGYGSINHQSVDIGAKASYLTPCDLTVSIGYAWRAYAHNFPKNANTLIINLLYPFSL